MISAHDSIEEIHEHLRYFLAELDRAATASGVPYFLAYGTALGAVREGDLIPWDVDVDVWIPSDQHQRLLSDVAPLLPPDLVLLSPENDPGYEYLFPRIARRDVHHSLLSLDLFPLDPAPRSGWARWVYGTVCRLIDRAFFVKRADLSLRHAYSPTKRQVFRLLRAVSAPIPTPMLLRAFRCLQMRHSWRGSGMVVNPCGAYGRREFFPSTWFATSSRLPLGTTEHPVPGGYDAVLTQLYGDYRTPLSSAAQLEERGRVGRAFVEPLRLAGVVSTGPEGG